MRNICLISNFYGNDKTSLYEDFGGGASFGSANSSFSIPHYESPAKYPKKQMQKYGDGHARKFKRIKSTK